MLDTNVAIGATTGHMSFSDMIIGNIEAVAQKTVNGFATFIHDPASLVDTVAGFVKQKIPDHFPDAVALRRLSTMGIDDIWRCPLNMTCSPTIPLPWTILETKCEQAINSTTFEFGIERRCDFIGRNYVKIILPEVDCTRIVDSSIRTNADLMSDPEHIYLGAWHRDLVPRLIEKVVFYTRSGNHTLYEYTGYDIYTHNILFGNKHKEMNDLMAGEDKFELVYDPFRVDGSAMGVASFKGVDAFAEYSVDAADDKGFIKHTAGEVVIGGADKIVDYFQYDTTMDDQEFREFYRKNVWYEAPVAQNYYARQSIHAHRLLHTAKDILIPLDILPFGYSIASSLPTAALAGDAGHIKVQLFSNWLDRAFYLTKCSDVPSLHPLVNHRHFAAEGETTAAGDALAAGDPRLGWVNDRSLGRYGDPTFNVETKKNQDGFDSVAKYVVEGSVLGAAGVNARENIVPTTVDFSGASEAGMYRDGFMAAANGARKTTGNWQSVVRTSTALEAKGGLTDASGKTAFIHPISSISADFAASIQSQIVVKLLQVGYSSVKCIVDLLSKLPNIYITNEWEDKDVSIAQQSFTVKSSLFTQAMLMWFLPVDERTGIESTRVYPNQLYDHEKPVIAGIRMEGESAQGVSVFDWTTLNQLVPAQIELSNPLLENMGLITFTPRLSANEFPFAFYDNNLCGSITFEFLQGKGGDRLVNLRNGKLKFINIGINGCALVNLSMFKLVF